MEEVKIGKIAGFQCEWRLTEESSDEAGAGSGQLEVLDGEREVVIIRIVDQEAVVDVLLDAFGTVASGHQRARCSDWNVTLFDADVLVEFVAVRLDFVDDDAPFAFNVDSPQRLNVGGGAGAQVGLFLNFVEGVDRVLGVDGDVLVQGQDGFVVLVQGVLDIVGRVFRVFQTPGFGGVLGTGRDLGFVVVGRFAVCGGCVGRLVRGVGQNGHETQTQDLRI